MKTELCERPSALRACVRTSMKPTSAIACKLMCAPSASAGTGSRAGSEVVGMRGVLWLSPLLSVVTFVLTVCSAASAVPSNDQRHVPSCNPTT